MKKFTLPQSAKIMCATLAIATCAVSAIAETTTPKTTAAKAQPTAAAVSATRAAHGVTAPVSDYTTAVMPRALRDDLRTGRTRIGLRMR